MSADSVLKLLSLPPDIRQPHAYQVFGLVEGEQDADVIQNAVQATIQQLRDVRGSTDADIWKQAAQIVQQSRVTLTDPQKKAELDARFGIVTISADDDFGDDEFGDDDFDALKPASEDPLAGLLPSANPLELVVPTDPVVPREPLIPTASAPTLTPQLAAGASAPNPVAQEGTFSPPKLKTQKPVTRRRRSMLPMLMFSVVVIGLSLSAVGLTYYMVFGPGQLAIQTGDGGVQISAGAANANQSPQVSPPSESTGAGQRPKRVRDPIMGTLGPELPEDTSQYNSIGASTPNSMTPNSMTPNSVTPNSVTPETNASGRSNNMTGMSMPDDSMMPVVPMPVEPMSEIPMSDGMPGVTTPTPEMSPTPATTPSPETMTAPESKQMQAAEGAIERAKTAIRTADWTNMKMLAEQAATVAVTDEQRSATNAMFQFTDLATFYRGGIERAIQGLKIGNTFDVTEGLSVIIVEIGADKLTIRFNAQNRSYTFNELPLALAHKLASFHVNADATGLAAKAAYQAITPVSSPQYREQSIQWLGEIDDEIAGADRDSLIAAIRSVFGS